MRDARPAGVVAVTVAPSVSVIIPTYNEVENICRIIGRVQAALAENPHEIIVVDDNSPDKTWRVAREEHATDASVRVIRRTDEQDLGTAVQRGFEEATNEFCAVIDADLQHPPERLPGFLDAFGPGVDLVIGSRHVPGGGIEGWPAHRHLISRGATWLAKAGVPAARGLSDPMSGFFVVRRSKVESVDLNPRGYKILLEILTKCDIEGVFEHPYTFQERDRGESKLTLAQQLAFVEHLVMLAVVAYGLTAYITPQRAVRAAEFAAIGVTGIVVNSAVFAAAFLSGVHYLLAGILAFAAAVQWNFVGNWLITFGKPVDALLRKYARFHAVSIAGFAVYTATLHLQIEYLFVPALVANVVAIGGSSVFNFLGTDEFAFEAGEHGY